MINPPMMNKSRKTMTTMTHIGGLIVNAGENVIPRKAVKSKSLSAKGSKKVPNSVFLLKRLAIKPSSASVMMAIKNNINARNLNCG